ncbi:MAG: tetratricopeptide repeat protein [Caldilineaceae bacterium]
MDQNKEKQTNQGWLHRLLRREQGNRDIIATQVGGDVQGSNIIGSKNVIQIGTLQAPRYLAVISILCLFIGLGFVIYPRVKPWLPKPLAFPPAAQNETLILIATFQVTEGNRNTLAQREIRDKLREKIQELHETNLRVEMEPMVLNSDQRAEAEALGKRYGASIVIWGDDTGARVTVNFLNLREPDFAAASVMISETTRTQLANPRAYAQFITADLPQQMTFLSLFAIGQSYYLATKYVLARERIDTAIKMLTPDTLLPGLANVYFLLGWLYLQSPKNFERAIDDYSKAIQLDSNNASFYNNRGNALYALGKYKQAIQDYDQSIKLEPGLAQTYHNRGLTFYALGKYEQAIQDYDQAILINSNYASAYIGRGLARNHLGNYVKAIQDFNQVIKFAPDYSNAYNNLCWIYTLKQQPMLGFPNCQRAIELEPRPLYYDSRGLANALLGDFKAAITDFQTYVAWLEKQTDTQSATYLAERKAWIADLQAGKNPFTPAVLAALGKE